MPKLVVEIPFGVISHAADLSLLAANSATANSATANTNSATATNANTNANAAVSPPQSSRW
jgi:hypothetical protein